jgi:hypothetical protein
VTRYTYIWYVLLVVITSRSFPRSWFITGFVTRLTRRVPLVEQELLTLSEQMNSPRILSGVRVTWSLVLYVCFVDRCLSFCSFSSGHCVGCSSAIYGFWFPLWCLQTILASYISIIALRLVFYVWRASKQFAISLFYGHRLSLCCWGVVVVVIVIGIYSYLCNQCASLQTLFVWIPLRRGVLDTTLCDHVYQWLKIGQWSSPVTPVFSTNKIDSRDLAEILLKEVLRTITLSITLSVLIDL